MDEDGQRAMLAAIANSLPAYGSVIRCWAAFCDAVGCRTRSPATESMAIRYSTIFASADTYEQYLKHLRCAHRFLRLDCVWYTEAVKQVMRGAARTPGGGRAPKVALVSKQVRDMVSIAMQSGELEVAALLAVARLFLLRVPSEGIPLTWSSSHSTVEVTESQAVVTLMRRKKLTYACGSHA